MGRIGGLAICVLTAFLLIAPRPGHAEPRTITVSGQGEVSLAPDMARITIGVLEEAGEAEAALAAMTASMAAVLDRLRAAGLSESDIQTGSFSLNPRYRRSDSIGPGEARIDGFVASSNVHVEIADLDLLGPVIDAAVADGANTLGGIGFDVADRSATLDAARRLAVADAAARAALYAEAAGVDLGEVLSVSEAGAAPFDPMPRMAMAESADAIAPGELTISARVTLVYGIADASE